MSLSFISLASGSSGNCYYVGAGAYGIVLDAGIGARTIKKRLKEYGIGLERVRAVLLTHDHNDHVKGASGLGEKYNLPIFSTPQVHFGIESNPRIPDIQIGSKKFLSKDVSLCVEEMIITPFDISHDGTDNVGYLIQLGEVKLAIATDVGYISDTVIHYLAQANYLVLEANYDIEMLRQGPYPIRLQQRIMGEKGHLSNHEAARFLADYYHEGLRHVWLCHLSQENNHPELALKTVERILLEKGIRMGEHFQVEALKRNTPSLLYSLD